MIQVRASLETYNGAGRISEVPATAFIIGTFKEFPLGNIKPQENMQVRQDIIDSDKKLVEGVINQLIQWIYEINFANAEVPVFELYEPEDVDLTLAQRDKILSDTGVKFTKEYFIKNYGLEEEDFDIREDIIPASPNFKEFKEEEEKLVPGQVQIENLFKFITEGDLNKQAQSMLSPLIKEKLSISKKDVTLLIPTVLLPLRLVFGLNRTFIST